MVNDTFLRPDPVTRPADLVGREAELARLQAYLQRQSVENVNIVGLPRIGKSSLLAVACRQATGWLPGYDVTAVWLPLVELRAGAPLPFWKMVWSRLTTAVAGKVAPEVMPASVAETPDDLFTAVSDLVDELLAVDDRRLLFFIDDFDRLVADGTDGVRTRDIHWLRALLTSYTGSLGFVIGSAEPLAALLRPLEAEERVSLFSSYFESSYLGLLPVAGARELCVRAAQAAERPLLSEADFDFLLTEAGRHPDLLKLACRFLFAAYDQQSPTPYDDTRADLRLDARVRQLCHRLWTPRSQDERSALLALASGVQTLDDLYVRRRLERQAALVERREGGWHIFADALAYCLRSHAPENIGDTIEALPPLTYLPDQRVVRRGEEAISLTKLENRLLRYLLENVGQVCTTEELLANVWQAERTESVVEKAVNRLRQKIEEDPSKPRYILSLRGEGYRLQQPSE